MGEKKRIQISISVEKLAELENFCRENGMSKSGALQYAWTEFLEIQKQTGRIIKKPTRSAGNYIKVIILWQITKSQ